MAELFIPNLQQFLGFTRNSGFARANRFLVEFYPPSLSVGAISGLPTTPNRDNVVGMLCEEANFPAKSIVSRSLRINALTEQRAHYVDYKSKEIGFKFLTDIKWQAKVFFDNWMALAINPMEINAARPREVGYYRDYIGEVHIYSLNPIFQEDSTQNVEVPLYGVKLCEAWPVSLDQQSMASNAENYHRLSVGITFKWWENLFFNNGVASPQGGLNRDDIINRLRGQRQGQSGGSERDVGLPNFSLPDRGRPTGDFNGFGGGGGFSGGGSSGTF